MPCATRVRGSRVAVGYRASAAWVGVATSGPSRRTARKLAAIARVEAAIRTAVVLLLHTNSRLVVASLLATRSRPRRQRSAPLQTPVHPAAAQPVRIS